MNKNLIIAVMLATVLSLTGCVQYRAHALIPEEVYGDVLSTWSGDSSPSSDQLRLPTVAQWMSEHNPDLQELKAAYATEKAVADIATALSNPEISFGLATGKNLGITDASKTQPFVSVGFSFPLTRERKHTDDLNKAKAELARVELITKHRELYLKLRRTWISLALQQDRSTVIKRLEASAQSMYDVGKKLDGAGSITGLELSLLKQEVGQRQLDMLEAQTDLRNAHNELAQLSGVSSKHLNTLTPFKAAPPSLPTTEELRKIALVNNPALAVIRSKYGVAEHALRLEVDKQYPKLSISPGFEQEVGEKVQVYELGIGIELPAFDRNKQGIAVADKSRSATRTAFKSELRRILGKLELLLASYQLANDRYNLIRKQLLPDSKKTVAAARLALEAGDRVDILRYQELRQGALDLEVRLIEARRDVFNELVSIEELLGQPLLDLGDGVTVPKFIISSKKEIKQ